jgi:hypothetical protein
VIEPQSSISHKALASRDTASLQIFAVDNWQFSNCSDSGLNMTSWFNISGTLSAFRLLRDPSLCLPHHTIPTFASLPVPLSPALAQSTHAGGDGTKRAPPDIRAVVLDKDNCFAVPHSNEIYPAYEVRHFRETREAHADRGEG